MTSKLQSRQQLYTCFKNKYLYLWKYISSLINIQDTGNIPVTDITSPLNYLFTCSELIFFDDYIKCAWDESTFFDTAIPKKSHYDSRCISLFMLASLLDNSDSGIYIEKNVLNTNLSSTRGNERVQHCIFGNTKELKASVEFHANYFKNSGRLNEILMVSDGYTLIPQYMKYIYTGIAAAGPTNDLLLDHCTDLWQTYAILLAAECMRALAILFYSFLWKQDTNNIRTEITDTKLKYLLCHIKYAYTKLLNMREENNDKLSNDAKREIVSCIALLKDTTIRVGITTGILHPLNKYGEPLKKILPNKYIILSETFRICNHLITSNKCDFTSCVKFLNEEILPPIKNGHMLYISPEHQKVLEEGNFGDGCEPLDEFLEKFCKNLTI